MANKGKISMMSLFQVVDRSKLKFLTDESILKEVLSDKALQPENLEDSKFDPNMFLVVKHAKKDLKHPYGKDVLRKDHHDATRKVQHQGEKKEKVYRKGPFAEFYEFSEGTLDKDAEVWYYKEGKQIIGPVSSYNMDKMVYHKTVHAETKVAFKTVDKFLKFSKVQAILQETKAEDEKHGDKEHSPSPQEAKPAAEPAKVEEKKPEPAPAVVQAPKEPPKKVLNLADPNEFPPL